MNSPVAVEGDAPGPFASIGSCVENAGGKSAFPKAFLPTPYSKKPIGCHQKTALSKLT